MANSLWDWLDYRSQAKVSTYSLNALTRRKGVTMRTVTLTPSEVALLDHQDPSTAGDGGWQGLLVGLQTKVDRITLQLVLDADDQEMIPRYAFDYGNGGWEARLRGVFERALGPNLGRP